MSALDLQAFRAVPLSRDPFEHVIVPGFLRPEALPAIASDFPALGHAGSFPVGSLRFGPAFAGLLDELRGEAFRQACAATFAVDLTDRPTMITVRGRCRPTDGRIHTDSAEKIITVLIYLNQPWEFAGGRLRLLRSPDDLDDFAAEVPPDAGTLLAFRRSSRSFHGHQPFEGERRAIQLNWVTSRRYVWREQARHWLSALTKSATA